MNGTLEQCVTSFSKLYNALEGCRQPDFTYII